MSYCWTHQGADYIPPAADDDVRRLRDWTAARWDALRRCRRRNGIEVIAVIPAAVVIDERPPDQEVAR